MDLKCRFTWQYFKNMSERPRNRLVMLSKSGRFPNSFGVFFAGKCPFCWHSIFQGLFSVSDRCIRYSVNLGNLPLAKLKLFNLSSVGRRTSLHYTKYILQKFLPILRLSRGIIYLIFLCRTHMKVGLRFFLPPSYTKMDGCEKKISSQKFWSKIESGGGRDNSFSQYALEMSCSTKSQISRVPFFRRLFCLVRLILGILL